MKGDLSDSRYYKTIRYILNIDKNSLIADLGCGQGRNLELLQNLGFNRLIGVDISTVQLKNAKEKVKDSSFILGDVMNLPFRNKIFDATLSTAVIEHIYDPSKFLSEISRITKNFGDVVISSDGYIWKFLLFLGIYKSKQPIDRPLSPPTLFKLFKENKFIILHYDAWGILWFRKLIFHTILFFFRPIINKLPLKMKKEYAKIFQFKKERLFELQHTQRIAPLALLKILILDENVFYAKI